MDVESSFPSSEPKEQHSVIVKISLSKRTDESEKEIFPSHTPSEKPREENSSISKDFTRIVPGEIADFSLFNPMSSSHDTILRDEKQLTDLFPSNNETSIEENRKVQSYICKSGNEYTTETDSSDVNKDNQSIQGTMDFKYFNPFNSPFNLETLMSGVPSSPTGVQFSKQPLKVSDEKTTDHFKKQRKDEKTNFTESKISYTNAMLSPSKDQYSKDVPVQKLCVEFLDFKRRNFAELQRIELNVDNLRPDVDSTIKDAENICKKLEKIPVEIPETLHQLRVENCKLKYLICTASRLFSKMDSYVIDLQKEISDYMIKTEEANINIDNRLENIINALCSQNRK